MSTTSSVRSGSDEHAGEDVWAELARGVSGVELRPELAADVEVVRQPWVRSGPSLMVARGDTVFSLDTRDAQLIPLLDGEHSLAELVAGDSLAGDLEPSRVRALVEMLRRAGFLTMASTDVGAEVEAALHPTRRRDRVLASVRTLSVQWNGADRYFQLLYGVLFRHLWNPLAAAVSAVVALAGAAAIVVVINSHRYGFTVQSPGLGFLLLLGLNLAIVAIHETGHGLVVVHYGRHVRGAGVRLYYGAPCFFVEVPQALLLSRRQRIIEAAAGPWFELVGGGVCSLVLLAHPSGQVGETLYRFATLNYLIVGLNLLPLLELDGYWIFADVLGITDLRRRSLRYLRHGLWQKLRARERQTRLEQGLVVYAVIGTAFAAFEIVVAVFTWRRTFGGVVAKLWSEGTLGRVLLVLLAAIVIAPLTQVVVRSLRSLEQRGRALARRLRFRLERSWRVEAAGMFDNPVLFEDLPVQVLNQLAGRVRLVARAPGQAIVRQGEPADAYYLLRRGRATIEEEDPASGDLRVLGQLEAGTGFGELGILRHERRNATIRAEEETELFSIDRGDFERLLLPYLRPPAIGITNQELAELASIPVLANLRREELAALASSGRPVSVEPGTDLVVEGAEADGFYVVLEGQLEVHRGSERLALLGPGDHFGEIALLRGGGRRATVTSLTFVRAFCVDPDSFQTLLASSPVLGGDGAPLPTDAGRHH